MPRPPRPCSKCGQMIGIGPNSLASPTCLPCRRSKNPAHNRESRGVCFGCGASFVQTRDRMTWCSNECRKLSTVAARPWEWVCLVSYKACEGCESIMVDRNRRRWCSEACWSNSTGVYRVKQCKIWVINCRDCGLLLTAKRWNERYCRPCRARRDWESKRQHMRDFGSDRDKAALLVDYIGHRDKWTCHICSRGVSEDPYSSRNKWSKTVDHVVPLSQGGANGPENLRLAHMICNARRGDRGGNEQLMLIG